MKIQELKTKKRNGYKLNSFTTEDIGDDHLYTGLETPMKANAFKISDEEKKEKIAILFEEIMDTMGLDLTDDSLKGTPERVAKMYIDEIFSGLNPKNKPKVALFDNKYQYNQMLVEKNITFYSNCEHHFVPIIGKAHVAYISSGKVIGLSKLNRIVKLEGYHCKVIILCFLNYLKQWFSSCKERKNLTYSVNKKDCKEKNIHLQLNCFITSCVYELSS